MLIHVFDSNTCIINLIYLHLLLSWSTNNALQYAKKYTSNSLLGIGMRCWSLLDYLQRRIDWCAINTLIKKFQMSFATARPVGR